MGKLTDKIRTLESKVSSLEASIKNLSKNTEAIRMKPESKVGLKDDGKTGLMPSTGTGLGKFPGNTEGIVWNDSDAQNVPWGQQPPQPSKGYNKHGHNEFSGGALDVNTLKLVEYVRNPSGIILDQFGNPLNESCQSYWKDLPQIIKDENGEEQISILADNMVWDKVNKVWRFYAVYRD